MQRKPVKIKPAGKKGVKAKKPAVKKGVKVEGFVLRRPKAPVFRLPYQSTVLKAAKISGLSGKALQGLKLLMKDDHYSRVIGIEKVCEAGDLRLLPVLEAAAKKDANIQVQARAKDMIGRIHAKKALPLLKAGLARELKKGRRYRQSYLIAGYVKALGNYRDRNLIPLVFESLDIYDPVTRSAGEHAMERLMKRRLQGKVPLEFIPWLSVRTMSGLGAEGQIDHRDWLFEQLPFGAEEAESAHERKVRSAAKLLEKSEPFTRGMLLFAFYRQPALASHLPSSAERAERHELEFLKNMVHEFEAREDETVESMFERAKLLGIEKEFKSLYDKHWRITNQNMKDFKAEMQRRRVNKW